MSGSKDSGDPSGQDPQSQPKANSLRNSPRSSAAPAAMDRSAAVKDRPSRAGNALIKRQHSRGGGKVRAGKVGEVKVGKGPSESDAGCAAATQAREERKAGRRGR